jgi:hypothetical protein
VTTVTLTVTPARRRTASHGFAQPCGTPPLTLVTFEVRVTRPYRERGLRDPWAAAEGMRR